MIIQFLFFQIKFIFWAYFIKFILKFSLSTLFFIFTKINFVEMLRRDTNKINIIIVLFINCCSYYLSYLVILKVLQIGSLFKMINISHYKTFIVYNNTRHIYVLVLKNSINISKYFIYQTTSTQFIVSQKSF